jgi:predicted  nucleic acid-binding Zn-ribbon protein
VTDQKTRADLMEEMLACDARQNTLREYIARAKATRYAEGKWTKSGVFADWQRESSELKVKRQRLQFELGELTRREKYERQAEADRRYIEELKRELEIAKGEK